MIYGTILSILARVIKLKSVIVEQCNLINYKMDKDNLSELFKCKIQSQILMRLELEEEEAGVDIK